MNQTGHSSRAVAEMCLWKNLCISVLLALLTKVQNAQGSCEITSITSPSASSLNIKWTSFPGSTNYLLELRVVNSTSATPVVTQLSATTTEKLVQGLKPGTIYQVTLKVYQFYNLVCINSKNAQTVPETSQITLFKAISSTSISFRWSSAVGATSYILVLEGVFHTEYRNLTFTSLSGEVTGLQPAKTYNCAVYSSNNAGLGAKSSVKAVSTLFPSPGSVNVTTINFNTALVTWSSVSGVVYYRVELTENNQSGSPPLSWNSSVTFLNIGNLKPCSRYIIGVSSLNTFLQPGEPNNVSYTTRNIDPVSSILVNYNCKNATATVTWAPVNGAYSYRAVATGRNGATLSCTSSGTSCQISSLACGERYRVEITAIGNCQSISNTSYSFETVPCPPQNLEIYLECSTNVIVLSWAPTNTTAFYIAKSVDPDGLVNECQTLYNSCYFVQMQCGRSYRFTVSSVYSNAQDCNSGISMPINVSTTPCPPQNVYSTLMNCQSNVLVNTWDPSPGALNYMLQASGNENDFLNCSSQSTSCEMTGVKCGQTLSVWMTASNNVCTTEPMLVNQPETAPCAPQLVSAVKTCDSFSITLSWLTSSNTMYYTAIAVHPSGMVYYCNTVDTQCNIQGLQCGQTYEAYVVSTNVCNSTDSQRITVHTAPCAPVNVQVVNNCKAKTATVQWQGQQAGGSYFALLQDENGAKLNCSSTGNNCSISNLNCGLKYNATVTQIDRNCSSLPSTAVQMESIPCAPQQVVANVNCMSRVIMVGWYSSVIGATHMAVVQSGVGGPFYCNSSELYCSVKGTECGKTYTVEVTTTRGTCQSAPSTQITVEQVPCVPTDVSVSWVCGSSSAVVSWASSAGAYSYTVIVIDTDGQRSECTSSTTSCSISDLSCSQNYSIGVVAKNQICTSELSQTVTLYTDPCTPTDVSGLVDCSSSTASLTWTPSPNAVRYIGRLASSVDVRSVNVSTTGCQIAGLLCGQRYNFSVFATDGKCASTQSSITQINTAPCSPQYVFTTVACNTNSLTVSWNSTGAQSYVASAVWSGGSALSCNTQSSSCTMQGLQCGQQYNISVTASNNNCVGQASPVQTVKSAPCVPQNVKTTLPCNSSTATVTWGASAGADTYTVLARTGHGQTLATSCSTSSTSCPLTALTCGSTYSITVLASNANCNSTSQPSATVITAPCAPANLAVSVDCSTNRGILSWNSAAGAMTYRTSVIGGNGHVTACSTNSTSCEVTLNCGQNYLAEVVASSDVCNSPPSSRISFLSAPCVPQNITGVLDCASNNLTVQWQGTSSINLYTATVTSSAYQASCSSSSSSCPIMGVPCGQTFNISVSSSSGSCSVMQASASRIQSAPCVPQNITGVLDCASNNLTVQWQGTSSINLYTATVTSSAYQASCSSSSSSCPIMGVPCGQTFNISVSSSSGSCSVIQASASRIQSAPCQPQKVSVELNCDNNSAVVKWTAQTGALNYLGSAKTNIGPALYCQSTSTSCTIEALQCSAVYSFTVLASNGVCNSSYSNALTGGGVPCPPVGLRLILSAVQNGNQLLKASWSAVSCPNSVYLLEVTESTEALFQLASYWTQYTFFEMPVPCGSTYNATVKAQNIGGDSAPSAVVTGTTAPCSPQSVTFRGSFTSAVVAWAASQYATKYHVYKVTSVGRTEVCCTSQLSCTVTNSSSSLIIVTASNAAGESEASGVQQVRRRRELTQVEMGELTSQQVNVTMVTANSVWLQWNRLEGTEFYTLLIQEQSPSHSPSPIVMNVYGETAVVSDLNPTTTYCITLSPNSSGPSSGPVCVQTSISELKG